MNDEDDIHDKLTKAYLEYFKANAAFEQRPGELKRREARRWLSVISKLAKERRNQIMETHLKKFDDGRVNNWKYALNARQKKAEKKKAGDT